MVYFSVVPLADWPRAVDARASSPWHRASLEVGGDSLDGLKDEEGDERTSYAHEKL
jgi:hypothetical protein